MSIYEKCIFPLSKVYKSEKKKINKLSLNYLASIEYNCSISSKISQFVYYYVVVTME